jgi:co-chaperonin GroES (HSP10)
MTSRALEFEPYNENILVRLLAAPVASGSLIVAPETADTSFARGPEFRFSGKGVRARVLAVGRKVSEVTPGDVVLVDKLCGDLVDELEGVGQDRELRMVCEPAIVAVLESSPD